MPRLSGTTDTLYHGEGLKIGVPDTATVDIYHVYRVHKHFSDGGERIREDTSPVPQDVVWTEVLYSSKWNGWLVLSYGLLRLLTVTPSVAMKVSTELHSLRLPKVAPTC